MKWATDLLVASPEKIMQENAHRIHSWSRRALCVSLIITIIDHVCARAQGSQHIVRRPA